MASRDFVIIATADALAPNRHQGISCNNDDISSVEYVETKHINYFLNTAWYLWEKLLEGEKYWKKNPLGLNGSRQFINIGIADDLGRTGATKSAVPMLTSLQ